MGIGFLFGVGGMSGCRRGRLRMDEADDVGS